MAAIQFPNNPSAGDLFLATNGIRYTYDGEKWKTLGTSTVGTEGQFLETPTALTINKTIPANTNTGAVGGMAINSGVVLTVPSTSTFRTLSGKSGGGSSDSLSSSGGTMTGTLVLAGPPTANLHAVTKAYVDALNSLSTSGGTMTGTLVLAGPPTSDLHAVTKAYVDDNSTGTIVADGGNFNSGTSLISTSTTYDGGSFN